MKQESTEAAPDSRGRSLFELLSDRFKKQGWYDTAAYWDMKAEKYAGLARSNWPSNVYNEHVHSTQMATIDRLLGDVAGLSIADVGCGTGRTARHLAARGARVHAWDFSPKAVEAARAEAEAAGCDASFAVGNVLEPAAPDLRESFDVVISLGCLTLACRDSRDFDRAVGHLVSLLQPGGRLLFIEPIHRSRLLKRILPMSVDEWVTHCWRQPLTLEARGGMMFVPARYLLAFRDLPDTVVAPVFDAGESVLALSPRLERFSDYKYLLFTRQTYGPASPRAR